MLALEDRGSASIEYLLLVPLVVVGFYLVAWAGSLPQAHSQARSTARFAARAAAIQDSPALADQAAIETVAAADLPVCDSVASEVDISGWADGTVSVKVVCDVTTVLGLSATISESWAEGIAYAGRDAPSP